MCSPPDQRLVSSSSEPVLFPFDRFSPTISISGSGQSFSPAAFLMGYVALLRTEFPCLSFTPSEPSDPPPSKMSPDLLESLSLLKPPEPPDPPDRSSELTFLTALPSFAPLPAKGLVGVDPFVPSQPISPDPPDPHDLEFVVPASSLLMVSSKSGSPSHVFSEGEKYQKYQFSERMMCKSFSHSEEESNVFLPCTSPDCFQDLTLLRSELRKDSQLSLQPLHHVLATSSCIYVISTLVSDYEVLFNTLRLGLDTDEIAGFLLDIRNLATFFYPLSFHFVLLFLFYAAVVLAKFALYCLNFWVDPV
ncbi:unnamed protein product [Thlaspi arvense]|uniref:Uncharacterized protein n=1 Tax=Thlaspi arvense TaxID=13288 RepID=A0AAU9STW2_THLAR|nr:unnamed protein product [Thlaspi arvense]